jgi:hypothetical protein
LQLCMLKHDQFPICVALAEPQDVPVAVVSLRLQVAVVVAIPLIEVVADLDLASAETKPPEHFRRHVARIGLYASLHVCPGMLTRLHFRSGSNDPDPKHAHGWKSVVLLDPCHNLRPHFRMCLPPDQHAEVLQTHADLAGILDDAYVHDRRSFKERLE